MTETRSQVAPSSAGSGGFIRVPLGPVFPRLMALYVSIVVVGVCWVMPLLYPVDANARLLAFVLGLFFLAVLFVPRLGTIEVDANSRVLTFRESSLAVALHPWRKREVKHLTLPQGCRVTVGEWLDGNAFATLGIKRTLNTGEESVLLQQKFAFNIAGMTALVTAIRGISGVEVEAVRLNETFQSETWNPPPSR